MVSRKEWYARANAVWPAELPQLTAEEAVRAARKLHRFVRKRKLMLPVKVTSGNRYSYAHGGVLYINPTSTHHGGGWKALFHDLSHWLDPGRSHSKEHARLEMRFIKEAVRRGWLTGTLKDKLKAQAPKPDQKAAKHQSIVVRIDRWLAKKKRAERALAKLNRQRKYYERRSIAA